MNILIVNLKTSRDRLDFQKKQFEKLGLNFEVLEAFSVANLSEEQYQKLGFGWQRPLRKVEVACFLSHQKAWEEVLNRNQPCLILEDDAVLASNTKEILNEIEQHQIQDVDLINLEVRSRKKIISRTPAFTLNQAQVELYNLYQDRTGAAGYILYPSGAKKLLNRLARTAPAIADGFIFSAYELQCLQVEPAVIIQEDQLAAYGLIQQKSFDSTIGRSENFKAEFNSFAEKIAFKKRRLVGQIAMAIRYFQVMGKAEKRLIKLNQEKFIRD
ncbi:glycosyltransferase family 25 protein [Acinetobacter sp. BY484]|uniref:glycosyltransferase family 25 protein n=1 Tax=unclassified Acinetobacter TaxID=196816 RepID=UPI00349F983C